MSPKVQKPEHTEWPIQFGREAACGYLLKVYDIPMTPTALAMHDARGTGPERRVVLNRTYYLRTALDKWVAEMGARGTRRRRKNAA
jgi:hypothetical protein